MYTLCHETISSSKMGVRVEMWSLAVLVLLTGGCLGATESSSGACSQDVLMSCAYPNTVEKGIRFAMSEEELERNCPHLHAGLRCIDTYTRDCLEPEQRSSFYRSYTGAGMVLQEICTSGPYRDQFLRLAPCMNNVTVEYLACAERYEKALGRWSPGVQICGELEQYVACSERVVLGTCGEEAAAFTAGFLHRMTDSIFREHCPAKDEASAKGRTGVVLSFLASAFAYFMS